MKHILAALFLMTLSLPTFASDCVEESTPEIKTRIAKRLKTTVDQINLRYLGGETLDGDYTSDGLYYTPTEEYFDVSLASAPSEIKDLFIVSIGRLVNEETEEAFCEVDDLDSVSRDEWSEIYDIYL